MKRIANVLFAATIATAASSVMAGPPSSVNETSFLYDSFPNITTYADLHKNDIVRQTGSPFPSSSNETTFLSDSFPQITTYADLHKDERVKQANSPAPSSAM